MSKYYYAVWEELFEIPENDCIYFALYRFIEN